MTAHGAGGGPAAALALGLAWWCSAELPRTGPGRGLGRITGRGPLLDFLPSTVSDGRAAAAAAASRPRGALSSAALPDAPAWDWLAAREEAERTRALAAARAPEEAVASPGCSGCNELPPPAAAGPPLAQDGCGACRAPRFLSMELTSSCGHGRAGGVVSTDLTTVQYWALGPCVYCVHYMHVLHTVNV